MSIGEYCIRDVVVIDKTESIREAIRLIRAQHVGALVVVEQNNDKNQPIGMLTDRDIVIEVLAEDIDLDAVTVGDVMSFDILLLNESVGLMPAIKTMRDAGVRRAPIVNDSNQLIGILSVDDILDLLAEQLFDLAKLISKEQRIERTKTI